MKLYRIQVNYEKHFYVEANDHVQALTLFIEDRRKSGFEGTEYSVYTVEYVGSVLRKDVAMDKPNFDLTHRI